MAIGASFNSMSTQLEHDTVQHLVWRPIFFDLDRLGSTCIVLGDKSVSDWDPAEDEVSPGLQISGMLFLYLGSNEFTVTMQEDLKEILSQLVTWPAG